MQHEAQSAPASADAAQAPALASAPAGPAPSIQPTDQFAPTRPAVKRVDPTSPNYEAEKKEFYDKLFAFLKKRGSPLYRAPRIGRREYDLYLVYHRVAERGGLIKVLEAKAWKEITAEINLSAGCSNFGYLMRKNYMKYLWAYEQVDYWGIADPPTFNEKANLYYPPGYLKEKNDPEKRKMPSMDEGMINFKLNASHASVVTAPFSSPVKPHPPGESLVPLEDIYSASKRRDTGGVSKLHVALQSPLLSQRKWALDLLTPLSYAADLRLTQYGLVLDALVALLSDSMKQIRTDPIATNLRSRHVDVGSVLAFPGSPLETARRVLVILRNCSQVDDADRDLAALPTLPALLFECILAHNRDSLASRLALELLANFVHLLSDAYVLEYLPLIGHLLRYGDREELAVVVDSLRRLVTAQRIDATMLQERHPETGRSPLDDLIDLFIFAESHELALTAAEIFYSLSREESSCRLLLGRVTFLRKLLANVRRFIAATSDDASNEEFSKRCALTLVNLSKHNDHRRFLVCLEEDIANLAATCDPNSGLSPILFHLLTNVST